MGESMIQLISDGGLVAFAVAVVVIGAIALHRKWVVIGWQYTELRTDFDTLKESEKESNAVKRDMISALTTLTEEIGEMRDDVRDLRRERTR